MRIAYPTNDQTVSETSCTFYQTAKQITAERKRKRKKNVVAHAVWKRCEKKRKTTKTFLIPGLFTTLLIP